MSESSVTVLVYCWNHWKWKLGRFYLRLPWFGWRHDAALQGNRWCFVVGMCEPCRTRVSAQLECFIEEGKQLLAKLEAHGS